MQLKLSVLLSTALAKWPLPGRPFDVSHRKTGIFSVPPIARKALPRLIGQGHKRGIASVLTKQSGETPGIAAMRSGIVTPDEIAMLVETINEFCKAKGIEAVADRDKVAATALKLFHSGILSPTEIAKRLEGHSLLWWANSDRNRSVH